MNAAATTSYFPYKENVVFKYIATAQSKCKFHAGNGICEKKLISLEFAMNIILDNDLAVEINQLN